MAWGLWAILIYGIAMLCVAHWLGAIDTYSHLLPLDEVPAETLAELLR